MYLLLADIVVVLHMLFVLFVAAGHVLIVGGWYFNWQWTTNVAFRTIHLSAIGFVVVEAWLGIPCPLTTLEYELRDKAGLSTQGMSFIGYWVNRLLFYTAPQWVFTLSYSLFALLVAATFVFYPPKRKTRL